MSGVGIAVIIRIMVLQDSVKMPHSYFKGIQNTQNTEKEKHTQTFLFLL